MGITLTAGAVCLFLDLDWVPAMHWQAEDRFVRHGQKEKVQCIYLIAKDTIEENIYNLLLKKEEIFKEIIDGNGAKNGEKISEKQGKIGGSIMEDFLRESLEKAFKR